MKEDKNKKLQFYPSVSSVSKNKWAVIDHIELLVAHNYPRFLVSAFDCFGPEGEKISQLIEKAVAKGQEVLIDSGIYEVVWGKSNNWSLKSYKEIIKRLEGVNYLSYDNYVLNNKKWSLSEILESIDISNGIKEDPVIPIIHFHDLNNIGNICKEVLECFDVDKLAFAERELGFGLLQISKNIRIISNVIKSINPRVRLHILGTGNPISMMVYYYCGATSFDGLDWCQTSVDYSSAKLNHPLLYDLVENQSKWGEVDEMGYFTKCYLHNLDFYEGWLNKLYDSYESEQIESLLSNYLPPHNRDEISNIIGLK